LIKDFHEEFDTIPEAKKYVIRHKLHYGEQLVLPGTCLGIWFLRGQPCTATVSPCLINGECRRLTQDTLCGGSTQELTSKYVLAKTELLVYSLELRMAGQVDLLMRNEDSTEYHILDYKFIKEPLERKSYYNRFTRKYKMMSGPLD
jgi:hypothetical protein